MGLIDFIIFLFGTVGITIIFTKGDILEFFRDSISNMSDKLGYLVNCPMCSGFWIGAVSGFALGLNPILSAGMVSFFSWLSYSVVEALYAIGLYFDSKIENGEQ